MTTENQNNYMNMDTEQLQKIYAKHKQEGCFMDWEEWAVDEQMNAKTSLNMIPGGFKGMKFLHKHR